MKILDVGNKEQLMPLLTSCMKTMQSERHLHTICRSVRKVFGYISLCSVMRRRGVSGEAF